MPKPIIPADPVHGYALKFWSTGISDEVRERSWTFYLLPTPCEDVIGSSGVPYENQWYTGGGRFDGWELPELRSDYSDHSAWDDCFPTRLEALRHFQQQLKRRLEIEQKAIEKTRGLLDRVQKEIAGIPNKRDRRAERRAAAGKSRPGTVPAHRVAKLAALKEKP